MSVSCEFDLTMTSIAKTRKKGTAATLVLYYDSASNLLRSRLMSPRKGRLAYDTCYRQDPIFVNDGKALRRLSAPRIVAECTRFGIDPRRVGAAHRMRPKKQLVELLLARLQGATLKNNMCDARNDLERTGDNNDLA